MCNKAKQRGQGMIEYVILVAVIAMTVMAGATVFSGGLSTYFTSAGGTVNGLNTGAGGGGAGGGA